MNTTVVVIVLILMLGVGLYIGATNLAQQYAVAPGSSNAGQYACAPDKPTAKINQSVKFNAALPEGIAYYWSAPDASSSSFIISGPLNAQYSRAGAKMVYLFYIVNDRWYRTNCSTQVI